MTETPFTDRQIGLITGKIEPANNDEWAFIQEHASTQLPKPVKTVSQFGHLTGADLDRSRNQDKGGTQAGHIGENLDNED